MQKILNSVGRRGRNSASDVKVVQQLLNQYRIPTQTTPLRTDGLIGPKTIARIEGFQKSIVKMINPDGRVDPNGKTIAALLRKSAPTVNAPNLIYNIETGLLKGRIGNNEISAYAGSGGRAGSKKEGVVNPLLANNSLATHVGGPKNTGTHLFGPIPQGIYTLKLHESRSNWIRLNPAKGTYMHGRAGFAIHGRGQTGSHGCIVPSDFSVVQRLCKIVKDNDEVGNPAITLKVIAQGTEIGNIMRTA